MGGRKEEREEEREEEQERGQQTFLILDVLWTSRTCVE